MGTRSWLNPQKSTHPPLWQTCKVLHPLALFHETSVQPSMLPCVECSEATHDLKGAPGTTPLVCYCKYEWHFTVFLRLLSWAPWEVILFSSLSIWGVAYTQCGSAQCGFKDLNMWLDGFLYNLKTIALTMSTNCTCLCNYFACYSCSDCTRINVNTYTGWKTYGIRTPDIRTYNTSVQC